MVVRRFDVYLVNLDPTVGGEMRKTRPCVVISPDEMNRHVRTFLIAPLTSSDRSFPTRVECEFGGKRGRVVLDQIRVVDRSRLIKKLGAMADRCRGNVLRGLAELFAP